MRAWQGDLKNFFIVKPRLLTNFLCLPDHLICLSRIDHAGKVCLICQSRINQAGKGCLICLSRRMMVYTACNPLNFLWAPFYLLNHLKEMYPPSTSRGNIPTYLAPSNTSTIQQAHPLTSTSKARTTRNSHQSEAESSSPSQHNNQLAPASTIWS